MTSPLHVYFLLRSQKAFQRLLDVSSPAQSASHGPSTSAGKRSWTKRNALTPPPCDVNARDSLGRTVLHLAASCTDPAATEYVRMLLAHPHINVNLPDKESHWTALHRALYHGNLASALLLLQRSDIDTNIKDLEGYRAFDLYNSTVEGTKPGDYEDLYAELLTWGANRNAALGLGDGDDRAYPDQVVLEGPPDVKSAPLDTRFSPIRVQQVVMSKLHTAVVTTESRANVRACGFGSGGRLGPGQHTQYSLAPLPQFTQTVVAVALGQDHTLALTESGEVFSWGLNRFSQLGYVVEVQPGPGTRMEEPIQAVARKVQGALRNKLVQGVAACKTASACWTEDEVFTWGTNSGQLGYDKSAQPVQVQPRKVTKISQDVLQVTITDSAMACLLNTNDVVCIWNDGHFKVNFPAQAFPSEIAAYRPPQAVRNASIQKITSCDHTFAALSTYGELFTFTLPSPSEGGASGANRSREGVKPQRVWALRKQFSAVKDIALGADGSIIVCTESGHVFVRSRSVKSSQAGGGAGASVGKFTRVPYIQRVVNVCANNTGAYGALRVDAEMEPVEIVGNVIAQDLARIQPFLLASSSPEPRTEVPVPHEPGAIVSHNAASSPTAELEDEEDALVVTDVRDLTRLCRLIAHDQETRKVHNGRGSFYGAPIPHGADLLVEVHAGPEFPAHRLILAARSPVLAQVLSGHGIVQDQQYNLTIKASRSKAPVSWPSRPTPSARLTFTGCHPISVLILLRYLYSDEVLAPWDPRIGRAIEQFLVPLKIRPAEVRLELQRLARLLEVPFLSRTLEAPVKRVPQPSVATHMQWLFQSAQAGGPPATSAKDPLAADVVLLLADREVRCHSTVLRARSAFFAAFFDDEDWTRNRWAVDGTVRVDLGHLKWRAMQFVLRFMYGGDVEMFETLDFVHSVDELLEFLFDVMAAANELLLDRLVLICSALILKRVNISNVCSILTDATHFHAIPLVERLQKYMAVSLETILEGRMLEDLPLDLITQLSAFVRQQQAAKSPISRSTRLIDQAMEKHRDWLAQEDIPQPETLSPRFASISDSPKLSPSASSKKNQNRRSVAISPTTSPSIRPQASSRSLRPVTSCVEGEVFLMDDADAVPALALPQSHLPAKSEVPGPAKGEAAESVGKPIGGWKVSSTPKVDMKAIMAEAETHKNTAPPAPPLSRTPSSAAETQKWRTPQRRSVALPDTPERSASSPRTSSGSPWKPLPALTNTPISSISPATPSHILRRTSKDEAVPSSPKPPVPGGSGGSRPQVSTPRIPGMGPVFTPSKQSTPKTTSPSVRRVPSSGSAWTLPPVQPIVVQTSAPESPMSFAAIQQLQLQQDIIPTKEKRSLKEIQQEEAERQVEEDFLKWWAAEEERLKMEEERSKLEQESAQAGRSAQKGKKSRHKLPPRNADPFNAGAGSSRGKGRQSIKAKEGQKGQAP